MKKLVMVGMILMAGSMVYATDTQVNTRLTGGVTSSGEYSDEATSVGGDINILRSSNGKFYYGVELGATNNDYSDDDESYNTVHVGLVGKYYFNDNLYAQGSVGVIKGDGDFYGGLYSHDVSSPYISTELGYQFDNNVSVFGGMMIYEIEEKYDGIIIQTVEEETVVKGYIGVGYTF